MLCIKFVVFLTFWQGVIVAIAAKYGAIVETQTYTIEQSSEGLQDFIICIEMLIFILIYHFYAFMPKEFYNPGQSENQFESWFDRFLEMAWPWQKNIPIIKKNSSPLIPSSLTIPPPIPDLSATLITIKVDQTVPVSH